MIHGANGVVSVASHICGLQIHDMISAIQSGDRLKANELHKQMLPVFNALFMTSNPIPVKAALKLIGFNCGTARPPLMAISQEQLEKLETTIDQFFDQLP